MQGAWDPVLVGTRLLQYASDKSQRGVEVAENESTQKDKEGLSGLADMLAAQLLLCGEWDVSVQTRR
jgi:hypothetical protein